MSRIVLQHSNQLGALKTALVQVKNYLGWRLEKIEAHVACFRNNGANFTIFERILHPSDVLG
jgi:hypothetical protein